MKFDFFPVKENALVFAALIVLLALGALVPAAGFVSSALFGFALPGFFLAKIFRLKLPLAAMLAAVVLSSVLVSTHAVYWVSLALPFGYSAVSISVAFALLSLLIFLVPPVEIKKVFSREAWTEVAAEARQEAAPLAGGIVVFVVFFSVLSASLWVTAPDGSVIVGGWNYSDFFLHMGIIETVNNGNFPPQEPTFAGVPIAYHWFSDLHTAFLSKASGLHPAVFARFETALYCALLFIIVYSLAQWFFEKVENTGKTEKKVWVKRAALLAAVLFVFGGSFAYLRLASDLASPSNSLSFQELIKNSPYDNDWKFFQVPSMIPGFLLVQRPQAVGLPVLALVLLLVVFAASDGDRDRSRLFLAGLLTGLLAPFQFYAFAAAALGATLWFALRFALRFWKERGIADGEPSGGKTKIVCLDYVFFFLPCAALATPFVFNALTRASGAGLVRFAPFWLAPTDVLGFVSFYAANLGVAFVLAVVAALLAAFAYPKLRFNGILFLAAFAAVLFAIPNAVSLSGTQWDMSKFFTYMLLPCAILAASLVARLPRALIALVVLAAVVTPVVSLYWYGASDWRGLGAGEREAGEWVRANTPERSVFLAAPVHNSAVDAVGGRLRIDGYSSWMNNYGLPYQQREADLKTAFCGSAEDAARVARKYGAEFVWLGGAERSTYGDCSFAFASSALFERVYDSGGVSVFKLA